MSSWDDVGDMVRTAVDEFGTLTGVVNNAGILRDSMVATATEADWDAVIAVHLKGTFAVTRHACEYWRAQYKAGNRIDARIVNTVSGAGLWGNVGQSAYGAAKAAIANLTVVTAMEGQRYGVVANAISPLAMSRMTEEVFGGRAADPAPRSRTQLRGRRVVAISGVGLAHRPDPADRRSQAQPHRGLHRGAGPLCRERRFLTDVFGGRSGGQLVVRDIAARFGRSATGELTNFQVRLATAGLTYGASVSSRRSSTFAAGTR